MSKYARIKNGMAVEVFMPPASVDITDCFHADIAALFTACPDDITPGSTIDATGHWTIATAPDPLSVPAPVTEAPKVSPIQFKLLFTAQERVTMKAARATDPVIDDFFDIVEDPRLTLVDLGLQSTRDALTYLVSQDLLTQDRANEVLAGELK